MKPSASIWRHPCCDASSCDPSKLMFSKTAPRIAKRFTGWSPYCNAEKSVEPLLILCVANQSRESRHTSPDGVVLIRHPAWRAVGLRAHNPTPQRSGRAI